MFGDFFRRAFQILALASVVTVLYLNFLSVPPGSVAFLQSQVAGGGLDNRGFFPYEPGITFVPTLFVPQRWRKYQLEVAPRVQEIRIRLPLRYSAYLRLSDLFFVQLKLRVEGEILVAESFAALKALQFRPGDRDKVIEDQVQFLASEYMLELNPDEKNLERLKNSLRTFFANNNLPAIQQRLDRQMRSSWYKLISVELRDIYVPDTQIYDAQTRNLDQVAAADRRALLAQIEKEADLAIERKRNLEDLSKAEKMAALISDHPDILEYYKIEKIAPRAGNVILDAASRSVRRGDIVINPAQEKKSTRGKDGKAENNNEGGEIGRAENGER